MLMEDGTYDDAWLWGTPLDEELLDWSQGIFGTRAERSR